MGIEDIQISGELETNAPSITYTGNEGPKSPQEEQEMAMKMAMAMEAEENQMAMAEKDMMVKEDYSSRAYRDKLIQQLMDTGGYDYGSAVNEADRIIEIKLRPKAAFGGIMGRDGRRQYGLGSSFKKFVRKIIPNEVAKVAEVAAPFVAPFNPIAAGLMSGIGGFDRTGRIGSSIKSGLMNYGMGQAARYLGGADFQGGFDPRGGFTQGTAGTGKFSKYFSKPTGSGGIKNLFDKPTEQFTFDSSKMKSPAGLDNLTSLTTAPGESALTLEQMANFNKIPVKNLGETGSILKTIKDFALDNKLLTGLAAGTLGMTALMGNMEPDEIQDMQRGEGLDIDGIRAEVQEAMADETGELLKALRVKYPFLGRRDTKDIEAMGKAMGGRIGYMGGGMTMGDPRMMMPQSRMPMEEGGIMDLGGMEKDYRAEGGFVPIGREEKADDVPARS